MHPTDDELIARVVAGDTAVFEALMRRYNERVYRVIRAIVKDDAEVEDAMQQAYVSAYTHLSQFKGLAQFSTWLTRIAINEARARARKKGLVRDTEDSEIDVRDGNPSPEEHMAGRELSGMVEEIVLALPESYREVFMMRAVEDMSVSDTAACLDVSEEVVKVRLHRARTRISDAITEKLGEGAAHAFQFHKPRCDRVVAAVFETIRAT